MDVLSFELLPISNEIFWIVVAIICAVIEAVTLGITSIWFAIGAIVALMLASFGVPFIVQVVVFLAVSIILLIYTRPLAKGYLKIGREKTNVEAVIGMKGVVIERIDNMSARGQIRLNGQIWSAKSESGEVIPREEEVVVVDVQGVRAIVKNVKDVEEVEVKIEE